MDHRGRWLQTAGFSYAADEDGNWRGHWIGRVRNPRGRLSGVSFASRRRGRVWAFWIEPGRQTATARPVVPSSVRSAAETLVRQREDGHPGRYDMVDQGQIDVLIDYVRGLR